ncbi:uncharacterized protein HMPREF1541_01390 [Cyphellophora europaea CBS 101466]|uniref:Short-chain dehydrogenase n=1 Tax=Cyphellophora europaea (strain CBS 101466) TaxID=1220924 RepID=W2SH55_CYPE1|nr:uncharacterized protein HMPREF1541_01390 [Cyphellophora europaea CBS 101466]ETN47199.1 hypothetical protein HMPREF1541_01390 [Cyphellophora europaea CBS 101466]
MATHPAWNQHTTATQVAGTFSSRIKDRTILIIGVSPNSLGASMAAALAAHSPALLILASRTASNLAAVAAELPPTCRVATIPVDLSKYASVREAAAQITALTTTNGIDIIINNAAIVHPSHILTTPHRHELQFATTFLGPFLLTNLLLPQLLTAAATAPNAGSTRIINITSDGHRLSPIRFSDPHFTRPLADLPADERPAASVPAVFLPKKPKTEEDGHTQQQQHQQEQDSSDPPTTPEAEPTYAPFLAYGQSKTANVLFSVAINAMLNRHGIAAFAVHPGSIWTELSRNLDEEMQRVIRTTGGYWKTLDEGGATGLVAALDPGAVGGEGGTVGVEGVYWSDCQVEAGKAAGHAVDEGVAERLWALGEREVGQGFDVEEMVRRVHGEGVVPEGKATEAVKVRTREVSL